MHSRASSLASGMDMDRIDLDEDEDDEEEEKSTKAVRPI